VNGIIPGNPCCATDRKLREGTRWVGRGWVDRWAVWKGSPQGTRWADNEEDCIRLQAQSGKKAWY
jgi:hypothetical protein